MDIFSLHKLTLTTKTLSLITIVFIFLAFWYKTSIFLDPDFGWEIRMGQYILKNGIPYTDPLSYTMPSYPIIAHYWLSSSLITRIYPVFGYVGLAGIVSCFSLLAMLILVPRKGFSLSLIPLLLATSGLFSYASVRPHFFTWLFLAFIFRITTDKMLWKKYCWYIPLLFILWTNIHGGFAAGLFLILIKLVVDTWHKKKIDKQIALISILSIIATFINPYGIYVWREIFITIFDPGTRIGINEWQPFISRLSLIHAPVLVLPLVLFARYFRSFTLLEKCFFVILLINGFSSSKMYPMWLLYSIYFSTKGLLFLTYEVKNNKIASQKLNIILSCLLIIAGTYTSTYGFRVYTIYKQLSEERFYPKKAVEFIKLHPTQGHIFSSFSWGGYVLWKLPEHKTFVDGRMPHWENQNASNSESKKAIDDFQKILKTELAFDNIASKYTIDTLLLPKEYRKKFKKFFLALKKDDWKTIYKDDISVILRKD